ncbi:MAG: hypothetical protein ACOY6E_02240 [Pseudomonadota bacterium]
MGTTVRIVLGVLAWVGGPSWAQFDPTEPPPMVAASAQPGHVNSQRLYWVRVDGSHSVAWYGGTTVRLGELVDDGRLIAIHEDHIVIAGSRGRRVVYLVDPKLNAKNLIDPR